MRLIKKLITNLFYCIIAPSSVYLLTYLIISAFELAYKQNARTLEYIFDGPIPIVSIISGFIAGVYIVYKYGHLYINKLWLLFVVWFIYGFIYDNYQTGQCSWCGFKYALKSQLGPSFTYLVYTYPLYLSIAYSAGAWHQKKFSLAQKLIKLLNIRAL